MKLQCTICKAIKNKRYDALKAAMQKANVKTVDEYKKIYVCMACKKASVENKNVPNK